MRVLNKICLFVIAVLPAFSGVFSGNDNYQKEVLLDNDSCEMLATFDESQDLVYNGSYYGLLARICKDYKTSNEIFDKVENSYKFDEDYEGNFSKIGKSVAGFLVNDTVNDYHSYDYERSMINIYKALNFLSLGDIDSANAELNRAVKRDELLEAKYQAIGEEAKKQTDTKMQNIQDNQAEIRADFEQKYAKFGAYKNNINPFGMYLRSLLYLLDNEPNKASDILRILNASFEGKNDVFKQDFLLAESRANRVKNPQKYIWLIYENGSSPKINASYFAYRYPDIATALAYGASYATNSYSPALLATINKTAILSVPSLESGENSFEFLSLNEQKTQIVSKMAAVMANELSKALQTSLSKAIYSNVAKDVAAASAGSAIGGAAGLVTMIGIDIYKQASNVSDTRMFVGLPNSFDAARVLNTGEIVIKDSYGKVLYEGKIDAKKDALIYIKSKDEENVVIYDVMQP